MIQRVVLFLALACSIPSRAEYVEECYRDDSTGEVSCMTYVVLPPNWENADNTQRAGTEQTSLNTSPAANSYTFADSQGEATRDYVFCILTCVLHPFDYSCASRCVAESQ